MKEQGYGNMLLDLIDVGKLLGVSHERARQMEVSALRKLAGYFGNGRYSTDWGGFKRVLTKKN